MPLTLIFLALLFLQTPRPGSISGLVTNAVTGAHVRKAHVVFQNGNTSYEATTDAEGRFVITGVNPAPYNGRAEHSGFEALRKSELVRVTEDQQAENITFQLTPLGVIAGRVLDENGEPMAQMSVQALVESYTRAGRRMAVNGMTQSDDRGEYRIFDLPAGRYYVMASNPSLADSPYGRLHAGSIETAYVETWYPGGADASQAAPNELAAGSELTGVDIRMRKARVYHIRGKAFAPGTQQRLNAAISLEPCGSSSVVLNRQWRASILRDGSFDTSGVVPGAWCVFLDQMTDNTHGLYARQTVTLTDHDVNNVTLPATPTVQIHGQLLVDGAPAKLQPVPVRLEPLSDHARFAGAGTQPDGTFAISNVPPESYRVGVNGRSGAYLKAVRFNGQDMPDGHIQVPPAGGQLTLLMATDAGELSGTAQAAGVYVTAVSSSSLDDPGIALTNPEGNFLMRGLPPGDYQVLAWEKGDPGLLQYPEFLKQFEARAVLVTVHPKGHETISLKPVMAAEIESAKARLR